MANQVNPLVGKRVVALFLAADRKALKFDLEGGESVIARADGDCCSSSWIEDIDLPTSLVGGVVRSVEDVDMPDLAEEEDEREVVAYYGCRITTDRGSCTIDYRNESNGYYGGSLSWPGDYFYGGVYGQNVSNEEWRPVDPQS